jgi:uncharacterized integral membrane protein
MQFFYWLIFLVVICLAIFAIQNAGVPSLTLQFLFWKFETPLMYTTLGSIIVGILVTLFFWIPRAIRKSIHTRELKKRIENLEKMLYGPSPAIEKGDKHKEP